MFPPTVLEVINFRWVFHQTVGKWQNAWRFDYVNTCSCAHGFHTSTAHSWIPQATQEQLVVETWMRCFQKLGFWVRRWQPAWLVTLLRTFQAEVWVLCSICPCICKDICAGVLDKYEHVLGNCTNIYHSSGTSAALWIIPGKFYSLTSLVPQMKLHLLNGSNIEFIGCRSGEDLAVVCKWSCSLLFLSHVSILKGIFSCYSVLWHLHGLGICLGIRTSLCSHCWAFLRMLFISMHTNCSWLTPANPTTVDGRAACIELCGSSAFLHDKLFCRNQDLRNLPMRAPVTKRSWCWSLSILYHDGLRCKELIWLSVDVSSLNTPGHLLVLRHFWQAFRFWWSWGILFMVHFAC